MPKGMKWKDLTIIKYYKEKESYPLTTRLFVIIQLGIVFLFFLTFVFELYFNHYPNAKPIWIFGIVFPLLSVQKIIKNEYSNLFYSFLILFYTLTVFFGIYFSGSILTPSVLFSFLAIIIVGLMAQGYLRYLSTLSIIIYTAVFAYIERASLHLDDPMRSVYLDWMIYFTIIALIILWIISRISAILLDYDKKLKEKNAELYRNAVTDQLTGVFNKRKFQEYLNYLKNVNEDRECHNAFLMIDIDYFKNYNDYYGHFQGDDCLKKVALVIQESLVEDTDLIFRIGGEEFLVILKEVSQDDLDAISEKIHNTLAERKIEHDKSAIHPYLTVSIGAVWFDCRVINNFDELIQLADDALYKAKNEGRNRTAKIIF